MPTPLTPPPPPGYPLRPPERPGPPTPPHLPASPEMPDDLTRKAHAIFLDALVVMDAEVRAQRVAETCGEDAALRAKVEKLLQADEARDISHEAAADPLPVEHEGERIGRYKLLQEIGEGGFGTVWMAEQIEPVSRRVALKIIKLGMDTREVIARFEAERQALAMMDHPNIAKVLDAGATEIGRPFFVMELVKGVPITRYCDNAGLSNRERLTLFGDVCSAINHAHQKGIIHRDIKPSNVMVTLHGDTPVVKVIDFGIAKATQGKLTDKTLFTRFEQFIGTPVYMSPEQASMSGLDVDTRSDIYALGILLYELLTGRPPFDAKTLASAGYEEMRRIIREVEPPKPSSRLSTAAAEERTHLAKARHIDIAKVGGMIEPDLDWIVMKAIEKDRTRRYETANGLALDIKRFLADEPVSATPPSVGYKFRKFARRNKVALRVASAIAAVLVAATAVSTWQAIRATSAEKKTSETLVQVAAERDAKDLARSDAETVSKFLGDVFQSPDPTRDGRTITVAENLDKAARKLESTLGTQPAQRASLQATLARTYHSLGLNQKAIPLWESVLAYYATFGPEHPNTLVAKDNLSVAYYQVGRREDALKLQEELLPIRQRINGPEDRETLDTMNNLALTYFDLGRRDEAIKLDEAVLALRRKILGPEHPDTLGTMNNLAASYADVARTTDALKLQEEALTFMRKVNGAEHPTTLDAMNNLAVFYSDVGREADALKLQEEILPLLRKVKGPEHPSTLSCMTNLARSYGIAGRLPEAVALQEASLALHRRVLPPTHPFLSLALGNMANIYEKSGRAADALKIREESLQVDRKVLGPEHPNTLGTMTNLARSYGIAGRLPEAIALQEQALAIKRRVLPPGHPYFAAALNNMADLYEAAGRKADAAPLREEIAALAKKPAPPAAGK